MEEIEDQAVVLEPLDDFDDFELCEYGCERARPHDIECPDCGAQMQP